MFLYIRQMTTKASSELLIEIVVDPGGLKGNYFVDNSPFESANVRVMIDEKLTRLNILKAFGIYYLKRTLQ